MRDYTVSLLKAWWGAAATADNDFCFDYLPRLTGSHSTYDTVMEQIAGTVKGYFLFGQNPAVGSANTRMQRLGMSKLDWLVVRDFSLIESATWWKDGPEIESGRDAHRGASRPRCSSSPRPRTPRRTARSPTRSGWCSGTTRRSGAERATSARTCGSSTTSAAASASAWRAPPTTRDRPVLDLTWDYPTEGEHDEPERRRRAGRDQRLGRRRRAALGLHAAQATTARPRAAAGSTAAATPTASTRPPGASRAREQNWTGAEWAWAWPANRRILYNRASADPEGRPWSERKALVWWDAEQGEWTGHDTPDFEVDKPPDYRPPPGRRPARTRSPATDPFIMQADGRGWLFAPAGVADGPLPTHYEPQDSPVRNLLHRQQRNPAAPGLRAREQPLPPRPGRARRRACSRIVGHHLPADRALHRRWHVALDAVPGRAAARVLLRGLAGARRRARPRARAAGRRSSARAAWSRRA